MNKNGHLGTLLLVFGALILVSYSLYMMYSFNSNLSKSKIELTKGLMMGDTQKISKNINSVFHHALGDNIQVKIVSPSGPKL